MDYGIYLVFTLFFSKLFSLIFTLKTRLTNFRAVRTNRPHFLTNAVNNFVPNHRRDAELEIVVCSDKFVGTALVPTKLVGTAVPKNLSEQTTWCSNRKLIR